MVQLLKMLTFDLLLLGMPLLLGLAISLRWEDSLVSALASG